MSVQHSLSLQIHPTKVTFIKLFLVIFIIQMQARMLHMMDPINYPDTNHKPELALALSEFHLLCGFRPYIEIADFIKSYIATLFFKINPQSILGIRELQEIFGEEICTNFLSSIDDTKRQELLRKCVQRWLDPLLHDIIVSQIYNLKIRIMDMGKRNCITINHNRRH
jgi:mannose-6-phosphate isomerase class I